MEEINMMDSIIPKLQKEAWEFLVHKKLMLNGVSIIPKEIEVYYFKKQEFEDNSVHKNELQQNNSNHFYIHRWGNKCLDPYKGGKYPGIDFVVSEEKDVYYSYLIRSALVNDKPVVGPHKVLLAIESACHLCYNIIEQTKVEIVQNIILCDIVLFSSRINLGKLVSKEFYNSKLRAVLCDNWFIQNKYPKKEEMIVNYLLDNKMDKEQMKIFAKDKLGYIPSSIRNY